MRAAAVALVALALAGCGGGSEAAGTPVAAEGGTPAPELGRELVRFAEAAARGDARAMWAMLSPATRESLGPTFPEFRRDVALELTDGIGTIARGGEVVLARGLAPGLGLAALAGERTVDGEVEDYAYAAAFVRMGGAWRLEIGGAAVNTLEPDPEETTGRTPELKASVQAPGRVERLLLWLDGEPVAGRRDDDGLFSATLRAEPDGELADGRHVLVVFGSGGGAAVAAAWPFRVDG